MSASLEALSADVSNTKTIHTTYHKNTGFIMSHEGFNFGSRYQMNAAYNLSIITPPVTSSVELRFEHFMVGLDNVQTCESQESQADPSKDLFSIYDGNNKLYSCGGGIIWGSKTRMAFNLTSTQNRLRFLLHAWSTSTTSYHGFLIEYNSKWTYLSWCPMSVLVAWQS